MMNEHCPTCTFHLLIVCITSCIVLFLFFFSPPFYFLFFLFLLLLILLIIIIVIVLISCVIECQPLPGMCHHHLLHVSWNDTWCIHLQTKLKHLENMWVLYIYVLLWSYSLFCYQLGVNPAWINIFFLLENPSSAIPSLLNISVTTNTK